MLIRSIYAMIGCNHLRSAGRDAARERKLVDVIAHGDSLLALRKVLRGAMSKGQTCWETLACNHEAGIT